MRFLLMQFKKIIKSFIQYVQILFLHDKNLSPIKASRSDLWRLLKVDPLSNSFFNL